MYKYEVLLELAKGNKKTKTYALPYTLADFRLKEPKDLSYIKRYIKIHDNDLKEIEEKIENLEDGGEFETLLAVSDLNILQFKLSLLLTVYKLRVEDTKTL